jgi:hypothetical protein
MPCAALAAVTAERDRQESAQLRARVDELLALLDRQRDEYRAACAALAAVTAERDRLAELLVVQ